MIQAIRLAGRELKPHKAVNDPELGSLTVLTNSPWDFVALWLKRKDKRAALVYWNQAREFAKAAIGMPNQSAPLLHYYSFMNATKALLSAKNITFHEHHGVRAHNIRGASNNNISLSNEGVRIQQNGVLPSLAAYMGDAEPTSIHSLQDLLFNLPCIHRTYCLTYRSQKDLFIPLRECRYVVDRSTGKAFLVGEISENFPASTLNRLPAGFSAMPAEGSRAFRSIAAISMTRPLRPAAANVTDIKLLHKALRADLQYIDGAQTLWYLKAVSNAGASRLARSTLTISLAAMHRLSELCRYRPIELASFLSGQRNWLLSEFVQMAPPQFIDEIAAEITGHQVLTPNVRPAT